jgi:hypothetical protein
MAGRGKYRLAPSSTRSSTRVDPAVSAMAETLSGYASAEIR